MRLMTLLIMVFLCLGGAAQAVTESSCARVKIEIAQELTLERVAFDATMVIHNKITDQDLTDIPTVGPHVLLLPTILSQPMSISKTKNSMRSI